MTPLEIHRRVRAWYSAQAPWTADESPRSVHLDELLGKDADRSLLTAQTAYEGLLDALGDGAALVVPLLVIPLASSPHMDPHLPGREELQDPGATEPPGLYLVERSAFTRYPEGEVYRCPVPDLPAVRGAGGEALWHYECARTPEAIANGWEYSRGLYLKHYRSARTDTSPTQE